MEICRGGEEAESAMKEEGEREENENLHIL